jgi:hypothetical protein
VSSTGFGGTIESANEESRGLVRDNRELQWNEGYYRGYYELQVSPERIDASYFGKCSRESNLWTSHVLQFTGCVVDA